MLQPVIGRKAGHAAAQTYDQLHVKNRNAAPFTQPLHVVCIAAYMSITRVITQPPWQENQGA